jgi:hypothetical protein
MLSFTNIAAAVTAMDRPERVAETANGRVKDRRASDEAPGKRAEQTSK